MSKMQFFINNLEIRINRIWFSLPLSTKIPGLHSVSTKMMVVFPLFFPRSAKDLELPLLMEKATGHYYSILIKWLPYSQCTLISVLPSFICCSRCWWMCCFLFCDSILTCVCVQQYFSKITNFCLPFTVLIRYPTMPANIFFVSRYNTVNGRILLTVYPREHCAEPLGRRIPRSDLPDLGSGRRLGHGLLLHPAHPGLLPLLLLLSNCRLVHAGDVYLE